MKIATIFLFLIIVPNISGTWDLKIVRTDGSTKPAIMKLLDDDGIITGTLFIDNLEVTFRGTHNYFPGEKSGFVSAKNDEGVSIEFLTSKDGKYIAGILIFSISAPADSFPFVAYRR